MVRGVLHGFAGLQRFFKGTVENEFPVFTDHPVAAGHHAKTNFALGQSGT